MAIKTILENGLIDKSENDTDLIKEFILNPKEIIRVHDLVNREVEYVCKSLQTETFSLSDSNVTNEATWIRVNQYEIVLQKLLHMVIVGCYWGKAQLTHFGRKLSSELAV